MGFEKVKLPDAILREKELKLNSEILLEEPLDSNVKLDILTQVFLYQGLNSHLRANGKPYITVDQETPKINPDTQTSFKYNYALNIRAENLDHKSPLLTIYYEDFLYPVSIGFEQLVWEEIKMQAQYYHIDNERYYLQAKSESAFLTFLELILGSRRIRQVISGLLARSAYKAESDHAYNNQYSSRNRVLAPCLYNQMGCQQPVYNHQCPGRSRVVPCLYNVDWVEE
ncbi:hypothetical protein K9N68_31610 [Kovacikia minuta CCNUW1]|uniref:hypothetical protein n=1 Tax=Kovacikia minuta TaxID=2931930 RepID=UPI001CCFCBC6|nr:hypothetical protein [Kovacikia minuta]UBF26033.1 hypothetical protein K9N68_31610 [Kovacikia minuta CCNUW1]